MEWFLIIGSIVAPSLLVLLQSIWSKLTLLFNGLAVLSAVIFGNISSLAIYRILKDNTVFMTNIHGIFLNPIFLGTGAYLGVYVVYRLMMFMPEKSCS